MSARICVVGSVNMDMFVSTPRIPCAGETILGGDILQCVGGKGANQAIAARLGGAQVAFVGAVGDDAHGRTIRAELKQYGIDVALLATSNVATASAIVAVAESGENAIIVSPGANYAVDTGMVDAARAMIREADALVLQLELRAEAVVRAAELAAELGTPVIVNAAPIPADLRPVMAVIESCDVLIVNEGECAAVCQQTRRSPGSLGPQLVIETRGAAGLVYWMKGMEHALAASVLPAETPVIDTVGAGDAFAGVLAMRWAELKAAGGLDESGIRDAMYWAAAAGALACTKRGAGSAMPTRAQVVKLLQMQA